MIRLAIKILVAINNLSYKLISSLAVRDNSGIHPKHEILKYHNFFLNNIDRSDTILDIGCGNGAVAYDIAQKAKKVVAIDISQKNIKTARNKFNHNNLEYITGNATNYDFKNKFDVIILSNVLEHIENRIDFLKKISYLSEKILIRVPLINRDWFTIYKKSLGLEYRLDKTHFLEYTLEILEDELLRAGLKLENYDINFGEIWAIAKKLQ